MLSRLDPERAAELLALLPPSEAVALLACLADTSTRLVAEALQPQDREALMAVGGGGGLVGSWLSGLWLRVEDQEALMAVGGSRSYSRCYTVRVLPSVMMWCGVRCAGARQRQPPAVSTFVAWCLVL